MRARALAIAVMLFGAGLVVGGVFSIERGWLVISGVSSILAGQAMLMSRREREVDADEDELRRRRGAAGWQPGGLPPKPPIRVQVERDREA